MTTPRLPHASPVIRKDDGSKDVWIPWGRTTPVAGIWLLRKITPARIVIATVLLTGFCLLLIATFRLFQH